MRLKYVLANAIKPLVWTESVPSPLARILTFPKSALLTESKLVMSGISLFMSSITLLNHLTIIQVKNWSSSICCMPLYRWDLSHNPFGIREEVAASDMANRHWVGPGYQGVLTCSRTPELPLAAGPNQQGPSSSVPVSIVRGFIRVNLESNNKVKGLQSLPFILLPSRSPARQKAGLSFGFPVVFWVVGGRGNQLQGALNSKSGSKGWGLIWGQMEHTP